jgi:hypothetical protein
MFTRMARNFIKNGYFPTDEATLAAVLSALAPVGEQLRIHDPCCGEGVALAEIQRHLQEQGAAVQALGIEFDTERAWHAKQLLDVAIHSDVQDVFLTHRSCGLLFLNPPYGFMIADQAGTGDPGRTDRLEKVFLRRTMNCLQIGGVLVLIVPHTVVDEDLAGVLARNFTRLQLYMAPERQFRQCVIFGVRRRPGHPSVAVVDALVKAAAAGEQGEVLPEQWPHEPYGIPPLVADPDFRFSAIRIDAPQLADELRRLARHTLWPQFQTVFAQTARAHRPPLRPLSKWHLALALAAGQVTGTVRGADGRMLFIKGDTYKQKTRTVEHVIDEKGDVSETVVLTDTFVPIIRGIDFTPGPGLGAIVTIR